MHNAIDPIDLTTGAITENRTQTTGITTQGSNR